MPDNPDEEKDDDDELATRPHRKLELFDDDTHDDPHDFENQLTPPPKFLKDPPEPSDDDATRPHVLDDEGEVD